ncbi:hypothetical protein [Amycolatopsis sp. NBC_01480]|uniref:hypothetical protein n=1 Tax=Amycolatopsis sp. NBC_01480 TaxID=2903562 RepID=UPI002E2CED69|nr:hypothetical protein [Amycolatopsis sp. NBC_01480]
MRQYAELGARWDLRRTEASLREGGIRHEDRGAVALGGLDEVELRVADLVATGWSTADISMALSLTRDPVHRAFGRVIEAAGAAVTPEVPQGRCLRSLTAA